MRLRLDTDSLPLAVLLDEALGQLDSRKTRQLLRLTANAGPALRQLLIEEYHADTAMIAVVRSRLAAIIARLENYQPRDEGIGG